MLDIQSHKPLPAISTSQPPLTFSSHPPYNFHFDWPSRLGDSLRQFQSLRLHDESPARVPPSKPYAQATPRQHLVHDRHAVIRNAGYPAASHSNIQSGALRGHSSQSTVSGPYLGRSPLDVGLPPHLHSSSNHHSAGLDLDLTPVPEMGSTGGVYPPAHYGNSVYQTAPSFRNYNGFQQDSLPPLDASVYAFGRTAMHKTVSRPESPIFQADDPPPSRRGSHQAGGIVSYLQIPATISSSKGSLAEFAAQITCLFWFESSSTLSAIESSGSSPQPTARLAPEAIPPTGFLKWVTTILSTTQVTQNVILLALLFVYRLKKQNKSVKGKPGSEYRLLTVALMLGNKFLDDNTYTNKTWAEVSGISVQEIHVMEVEFLSHMKYNLYTSKEDWHDWHRQLAKFWAYFDRASRRHQEALPPIQTIRPTLHISPTLPSPPASTNPSPPYGVAGSAISPIDAPYPQSASVPPMHMSSTNVSPTYSHPDAEFSRYGGRKRSVDYVDTFSTEPPAKRPSYSYNGQPNARLPHLQTYTPVPHPAAATYTPLPSLPMPSLPMPSSQAVAPASIPPAAATLTPVSAGRATPNQTLPPIQWASGMAMQSALGQHPVLSQQSALGHSTPTTVATPLATTPSRRQHMYEQTAAYPSVAAHSVSPNTLSPSHFLIQRTSPYRPVRHMSQLLVPPPTGRLHQQPSHVHYDQMHWQPLGKNPSDRRTGRVPYMHREAWPQSNQAEQWPTMH